MQPITVSRVLRTCALASFAVASSAAIADSSPALDRVSVWLGGYYANTDVILEARNHDSDLTTGRVDLTHGRETVGRARLDLLLWDSQGFTFDYYTLSHMSSRTLNQAFAYDGIPYEINTALTGKLDFTAGSAAYHWWFGNANDVFGIGLGATYYRAKLGINGTAHMDGLNAVASAQWEESAVAPLITFAYKHAFSDELRVYAHASGVKKNGGKLSGHIYDARVGIEWFPWQNVGFGAEYGGSRIQLNRVARHYGADLDIELDGPSLFTRFRF